MNNLTHRVVLLLHCCVKCIKYNNGAQHSLKAIVISLVALCRKYTRGQRRGTGFLEPKARWLERQNLSFSLVLNPRLSPFIKLRYPASNIISEGCVMLCSSSFLPVYLYSIMEVSNG